MLTRVIVLLFLAVLTFPAFAQDPTLIYAVAPDFPTAQTYSQAAWLALRCTPQPGCDAAQVTQFWLPVIGLSDLVRYAIVLHVGDYYQGETMTLPSGKSFQLTAQQIAALQTRVQVGTLLPDVLPLAVVGSRLLPAETNAINAYAGTHPTFASSFATLESGPIDLEGTLVNTVFNELIASDVLTAARVAVILAVQPCSTGAPCQ